MDRQKGRTRRTAQSAQPTASPRGTGKRRLKPLRVHRTHNGLCGAGPCMMLTLFLGLCFLAGLWASQALLVLRSSEGADDVRREVVSNVETAAAEIPGDVEAVVVRKGSRGGGVGITNLRGSSGAAGIAAASARPTGPGRAGSTAKPVRDGQMGSKGLKSSGTILSPLIVEQQSEQWNGHNRGRQVEPVQREQRQPLAASSTLPNKLAGKTGLVIICYNRPEYLQRALDGILERLDTVPLNTPLDIYVSQDGNIPSVAAVATKFKENVHALGRPELRAFHINHQQESLPGDTGYHKLARHFGWALGKIFGPDGGASRVIVLEDDLDIAPDFFNYFLATATVLDSDPTIYCVSAYNDNGQANKVHDPRALVRSDFFPGLGWMMNKQLWDEIGAGWPGAYWDEWMRAPKIRKDRACIRPEVSRTKTYGKMGTSNAQYFDEHLGNIKLNDAMVDFGPNEMALLSPKEVYDDRMDADLAKAVVVRSPQEVKAAVAKNGSGEGLVFKVEYKSLERGPQPSFMSISRQWGLMDNIKEHVPRCAYRGVVPFRWEGTGARVFMVRGEGFVNQ